MAKNIESWSLSYEILRFFVKIAHRIYYKKIIIEGKKNIPKNTPVIFAPNHQNALMDALVLVTTLKEQIIFLGRADIFKKKFIAFLLKKLKILPVYRIRDGYDSLQKNKDIFDEAALILSKKKALCIFPEATHNDKRALLPLKKGLAKIALHAQNLYPSSNIKIVPVGIYYSNYFNLRGILQVKFGNAISVSQYKEAYNNEPQKCIKKLTSDIRDKIDKLIINIQDTDNYETYEELRNINTSYLKSKKTLKKYDQRKKLIIDKKLVSFLERVFTKNIIFLNNIKLEIKKYVNLKNKLNINEKILANKKPSLISLISYSLILIALSPIFVFGFLNNIINYSLVKYFIKKVKDPQFHSSFKFGLGLVLFPLIYLIQTIIFSCFINKRIYIIIYFFSLPLSGYFAYFYAEKFLQLIDEWNLYRYFKTKNIKFLELKRIRKKITDFLDTSDV